MTYTQFFIFFLSMLLVGGFFVDNLPDELIDIILKKGE